MDRRTFLAAATAVTCVPRAMATQITDKPGRVGWVTAQTPASLAPNIEAFRAGLAERGYNEGRNLTIEYRYGNGIDGRVPELTQELVRLPVDLIVAQERQPSNCRRLNCPSSL